MTELIMHIGLPKTGTSTLQHYLADSAENLRAEGVIYPNTGRQSVAHHELAFACRGASPFGRNFRELRRDFFAEIFDFERVVVSSEALQSPRGYAGLVAFIGLPRRRRRAVTIKSVCYLREFLDLACSSYAQQVQASNMSCGFEEFCARTFGVPLAVRSRFWNWFSDEVCFVAFERERLLNGDVVDDFFGHAGLTMPLPSPSRDANPSISGNLLAFKLMVNTRTQHAPKLYRVFRDLAGLDSGYRGRFHVSDCHGKVLRKRYANYNRTVAGLVGGVKQRSLNDGNRVFNMETWARDVEIFLSHPRLSMLKKDAGFVEFVSEVSGVAAFARKLGF